MREGERERKGRRGGREGEGEPITEVDPQFVKDYVELTT